MFRFMQKSGRDSQASSHGIGGLPGRPGTGGRNRPATRVRRRNQSLNCEALEGRQMLSGLYMVNASSGLVLDDPGFSTSNGAIVQQYQLNLGSNQQWNLVSLPDGNDEIVNAYSGKALDDPAFSTSNGTLIQQYTLNGGLNQQWKLVGLSDGNVEIVNAYSGKALDDPAFSASNGTKIQQYQINGGLNQQWSISPYACPAASTPYSPAPAGTPLFRSGGPSYLDVEQGQVGDCWLLASLAEVAARDPQDIENMFTYDGTTQINGSTVGLYTVRFFNSAGSPVYIKTDTELPSGGAYYDQVDTALGTQALWVALAEKAYAVANGLGEVTTSYEHQDTYAALNGGWPAWALQAITGDSASRYSINPGNIASAWNDGDFVVLDTTDPTSSAIVGEHCYAVVGYNASSGEPFEVFNPWGTQWNGYAPNTDNTIYGLFTANAAFISQNFAGQSTSTGAIDPNDIDRAIEELTELAPFGNDSDPSGLTRSTPRAVTGSLMGV